MLLIYHGRGNTGDMPALGALAGGPWLKVQTRCGSSAVAQAYCAGEGSHLAAALLPRCWSAAKGGPRAMMTPLHMWVGLLTCSIMWQGPRRGPGKRGKIERRGIGWEARGSGAVAYACVAACRSGTRSPQTKRAARQRCCEKSAKQRWASTSPRSTPTFAACVPRRFQWVSAHHEHDAHA
jgi:hypothetical protein